MLNSKHPVYFISFYIASLLVFGAVTQLSLPGVATVVVSFGLIVYVGTIFTNIISLTERKFADTLIFGAILGSVCVRISLVFTGLCLGPSALSVALAFALPAGVALIAVWACPRSLPGRDTEERSELNWMLALNGAVLLAMAFPFWGVGHFTEKGYVFVPHFNWDFFNHITHTAELSRSIPPKNPYFAGQTLHYYWFYYLWPAALVNASGVAAKEALVLTYPAAVFLFIGALSCLLRLYTTASSSRHLAVFLGLFASSYIGVLYVVSKGSKYAFAQINKITDMSHYSFLSHSWFRDFLYEPCSLCALTILVFILYLDKMAQNEVDGGVVVGRESRLARSLVIGLLLGLLPVCDLFVAMIGVLWYSATHALRFLRGGERRLDLWASFFIASLVVSCAFGLQLFPTRSGALRVGINPVAKFGPVYLLIELGPLFVFGSVGLYLSLRYGRITSLRSVVLLLLVALILGFTATVADEPYVVLRKAIKVVQVPLLVFASVACSSYLSLPPRHWLRLAGLPVILCGVLTLFTDIHQYLDLFTKRTTDKTTWISPSKWRALHWIRDNTPREAYVQLLDEVRPGRGLEFGNFEVDICLTALAERRTLFGNYKLPVQLHVPAGIYQNRRKLLEGVFVSKDPHHLEYHLSQLPEHYILFDRKAPGPVGPISRLVETGYLREVYRDGEISVVLKRGRRNDFSP
jgi:hypothetical protein